MYLKTAKNAKKTVFGKNLQHIFSVPPLPHFENSQMTPCAISEKKSTTWAKGTRTTTDSTSGPPDPNRSSSAYATQSATASKAPQSSWATASWSSNKTRLSSPQVCNWSSCIFRVVSNKGLILSGRCGGRPKADQWSVLECNFCGQRRPRSALQQTWRAGLLPHRPRVSDRGFEPRRCQGKRFQWYLKILIGINFAIF